MLKRFLDPHLRRLAKQYPVLLLTGPRQSGKTTLCQNTFDKHDYVNLEDLDSRNYAIEDPRGFLNQFKNGVILDEIQRTPDLPSYIQGIVDAEKTSGQFILTGSQQFEVVNSVNQSLAGRTAILRLLPLAYGELYNLKAPSLNEILYSGFYPRIFDNKLNPTEALSFYVSTYVERDLRSLIAIKDLALFERFLKICASQVGQLVNFSSIGNDCGIDQKTVQSWLSILQASYILYLLPPHFQNFQKRLTKSRKLYFYDVGLASYLLGITSHEQVDTHPARGHLFENFVVTEFLKNRYNHVLDNNLYFFRDHVGHEVDLLLDNGPELTSVEIKSGATINSDYFKGLNYYQKISGERNLHRYLIYAGAMRQKRHGIEVYPYDQLSELFEIMAPPRQT